MKASGRLLQNQGKGFGVALRFVNHNPNKRLYVQGQAGRARMSDDVGNVYENLVIGNELGIPGRLNVYLNGGFSFSPALGKNLLHPEHIVGHYEQIMEDEKALVRSDQPACDYFAFAEPVEGARALTVTLDAGCWGGRGTYVVKFRRIGTPGFWTDLTDAELAQVQAQQRAAQQRQEALREQELEKSRQWQAQEDQRLRDQRKQIEENQRRALEASRKRQEDIMKQREAIRKQRADRRKQIQERQRQNEALRKQQGGR